MFQNALRTQADQGVEEFRRCVWFVYLHVWDVRIVELGSRDR
jgi:hypothetical protein